MPTVLPNNVEVFNATAHELVFYHEQWQEPVKVASEEIINAKNFTQTVQTGEGYVLVTMKFLENPEGREVIDRIKKHHPKTLIVGSIIAAQAYAGDVVAPVPYRSQRIDKSKRYVKANRFTVVSKGDSNA